MKNKKKEKPKNEDLQKAKKCESQEPRETIETLRKEKDEFFAQLQRVSADYANYQKRMPKQIADAIEQGDVAEATAALKKNILQPFAGK